MKRLAAIILFVGVWPAGVTRAEEAIPEGPILIPTSPQTPAPTLENGTVIPASGVARFSNRSASSGPECAQPEPAACASSRVSCCARLKAWLCFQPTTRDALPKCAPHPYVGPVTGTFGCTSVGGYGCAAPAGCASGNGSAAKDTQGNCGKGDGGSAGLLRRGCKGECVTPSEAAFPGYHFATPESRAAAGRVPAAPPVPAPALLPEVPVGRTPPAATQPIPAGYLTRPTVLPTGMTATPRSDAEPAALWRPATSPATTMHPAFKPAPNLTRPYTNP